MSALNGLNIAKNYRKWNSVLYEKVIKFEMYQFKKPNDNLNLYFFQRERERERERAEDIIIQIEPASLSITASNNNKKFGLDLKNLYQLHRHSMLVYHLKVTR